MAVATPPRMTLADILLKEGIINRDQHSRAVQEYDRTNRSLVRILSDMEVLPDDLRLKILRKTFDCEFVNLEGVAPSPEVARFVSREVCQRAHAVPLRIVDGTVLLAMEDPTDMRVIQDFERLFSRSVKPVLSSSSDIAETIDRLPQSSDANKLFAEEEKESLGYRFLSTFSLALMVFGPMLAFMYFISRTTTGSEWYGSFEFSTFENALVFLIVWGCWASISYFITDLIFGKPASA